MSCSGGGGDLEVLRTNEGAPGRLRLRAARRVSRARRAERSRQVDARRRSHRPAEARPRQRPAVRRAGAGARRPRRVAGARGLRLPALDGHPVAQRRREHLPEPQRRARSFAGESCAGRRGSFCSSGASTSTSTSRPTSSRSSRSRSSRSRARSAIGARFLILDEPTASLESHAIERLFERVRRVKASGVAILYISHHLEEVYEICDRATVLRDGKRIVTAPVTELDHDQLVDGDGRQRARPLDPRAGRTARRRRGQAAAARSRPLGADAARLGRGRELRRACRRVRRALRPARLRHRGDRRRGRRPREAVAAARSSSTAQPLQTGQGRTSRCGAGSATCPRIAMRAASSRRSASRRTSRCRSSSGSPAGASSRAPARRVADGLVRRLQIVTSGGDQPVAELSGGNQQKVVVGRALAAEPSLLVVVSPTVGVDVASKEALLDRHRRRARGRNGGAARLRRPGRAANLHPRARRTARRDRARVQEAAMGPARADRGSGGTRGGGVTDAAIEHVEVVRRVRSRRRPARLGARARARSRDRRAVHRRDLHEPCVLHDAPTCRTRRSSRRRSAWSSSPSR